MVIFHCYVSSPEGNSLQSSQIHYSVLPHLPIKIAISWWCLSIQITPANCLVGRRPLCRPGVTLRSEIGRWPVWNTAICIVKGSYRKLNICWDLSIVAFQHPGSWFCVLKWSTYSIIYGVAEAAMPCCFIQLRCPTAMPIFIHCWKILRLSPMLDLHLVLRVSLKIWYPEPQEIVMDYHHFPHMYIYIIMCIIIYIYIFPIYI